MIPLAGCRHGWTYRIYSRNLAVGVFDAETKGFVGIRSKFGSRFLDTEFHWDTGEPYGTASPEAEVEECPVKDLRESFETICFVCRGRVHFVQNDRHGAGAGDWVHEDENGGCVHKGSLNGIRCWGVESNKALFAYLTALEARIQAEGKTG